MMGTIDSCSPSSPSTTFEVEPGQDGLPRGESVGSRRSRVVESVHIDDKERPQISPAPRLSLREATVLEPNADGRIVAPRLRPRQATDWNFHGHKTRAANRFAQATQAGSLSQMRLVESTRHEAEAVENAKVWGLQLHVRGIGILGWDGTPDSRGYYESEKALMLLFGQYGVCTQATVRHRIDNETRQNTSWALVTMADEESASQALAAAQTQNIVAPEGCSGDVHGLVPLSVSRFDPNRAKKSTGMMSTVTNEAWHAKVRDLIAKVPLFSGFQAEEIDNVIANSDLQEFQEDEFIFKKGDHANCMYMLLTGRVEVFLDIDGVLNGTPSAKQVTVRSFTRSDL